MGVNVYHRKIDDALLLECFADVASGEQCIHLRWGACASAAIVQLFPQISVVFRSTGPPCEQGQPISFHYQDQTGQQSQPIQITHQARSRCQHGNAQHQLHQFPAKKPRNSCTGMSGWRPRAEQKPLSGAKLPTRRSLPSALPLHLQSAKQPKQPATLPRTG